MGGTKNMSGYVDLHSHIVPGVDDGSESMEETIKMLSMAYDEGVRTMYATSHFGSGKEKYDKTYLLEQLEKVKKAAADIGDEGIVILPGNEIYCRSDSIERLKNNEALTLNGTRYILVEFPYEIRFDDLFDSLKKFIVSGYVPILAHIERYGCLYKKYENIAQLKSTNVLMQVNCSSVIPKLDARASYIRKLIKDGMIDFLCSDCHSTDWRKPCMQSAIDVLKRKTGEKILEKMLFTNHEKLMKNEFI